MPSIASTVSVGFGSWGSVSDTVSVGFGSAVPPVLVEDGLVVESIGVRRGVIIGAVSARAVGAETIGSLGSGLSLEEIGRR